MKINQNDLLNFPINRSGRRYDFDWLKVVATFTVFIFHCLRFFDFGAWHVKNNQLDPISTTVAGLLLQWIMPLFFLLSGTSIYFALKSRTAGQFLHERSLRLLIPLLFGIFILSPPQVYLERLSNPDLGIAPWTGGQFSGSFLEFIPHYFQGWYLFGGNFAWMGIHLWYLLVLWLFSLLLLPLFLAIKQGKGQKLSGKLAIVLEKPMVIFLLGLSIAILESGLDPATFGVRAAGGWNFFTYLTLILLGYIIVADRHLEAGIDRYFIFTLTMAVLTTPLLLAHFRDLFTGSGAAYGSLNYTLVNALRAFNAWCWLLAFLSLGRKFLDFNHRSLQYLSEASLPFYLLHQPIILLVGFSISGWQIGVFPKFIVLSLVSFTAIGLCYELIVRRINLLRFCFGLKLT
ncbi:acyltransferase family protein [Chamaesiphon polymorphus]|uniref:acyltransferase family protein n=1 Tax=Chamaesiphon polymorphus TaxID=2107691 RepID=UPI0015E6758D|nr:acyltransferase family protein [Chamaesiphon polymorphus]